MKQPPVPSLGDHELLRHISEGSYGEVWLARSELGTYRAIKIVRRTRFDSARPFQREYDGIKNFEPLSRMHEGLVDILHVGRGPGPESFYYIMELADDLVLGTAIDPDNYQARTLFSEVVRQGALSIHQSIQIGIQLARGLSFLHQRGLIHRDVKPSNVIFVGNQPKLADIGLITGIDDAKTYVGTAGYIPPEGPNSAQADIYSLGKLLYEVITGKDRNEYPVFPSRADYSEEFLDVNEVLVKACHTNPKRRYTSAAAMAAELEVLAAGKSVRRLHYLERKVEVIRQWWAPVAAIVTIASLLYLQFSQNRQRAREEQAALVGSKVGRGAALVQAGDFLGALPFFVQGLQLSGDAGPESLTHRLRIGSALSASPAIQWERRLPESALRWCTARGKLAVATIERHYSQVIDLDTGRPLSAKLGEKFHPQFAGFMPDPSEIITANWDESVRVIDWKTGETVLTLPHSGNVFSADASPDGRQILSGSQDGSVLLWDCQSQSFIELGKHKEPVFLVKFSPTAALGVSASADASACIWDLGNGEAVCKLLHRNRVFTAAFSPDEQLVATGSYDNEVRIWHARSGEEILPPLPHPQGITAVQFSPDGELILTACLDGLARLWSRRTHQLIEANHTLRHSASLLDASFAGSANQVLTAAAGGTLTLWTRNTSPQPVALGKAPHSARGLPRQSPHGKWILERRPGQLVVKSVHGAEVTRLQLKDSALPVVFSEDEKRLAVSDGTVVRLVELQRGAVRELMHSHPINFAAFSPDGLKLVCASKDSSVERRSAQLWNAVKGVSIGRPLRHPDGVLYAAFSPDSQTLITTCEDFSAILWNANSGARIPGKLPHHEKVWHASFARTMPWVVTASEDGTAIVWDSKAGNQLIPPLKHSHPVVHAEFTTDETAVITTDDQDNQWRWNLSIDHRPLRVLVESAARLTGEDTVPD